MRYKVPQNIDMPDRIIGPFTMIQFVEAVLGGGLAYVCYNGLPNPLNLILAVIVGIFTMAVLFVKINERPFLFYFKAFLVFLASPKKRVWQKDAKDGFDVEIYRAPKSSGPTVAHKDIRKKDMSEIAKQLDQQNIDRFKIDG